ncbi:hypothetical protein BJ742DRAFT_820986 [Cladochytrium replicatum]|nr:hypothetical protein BJ742DRAFT_820986 [Cladochytrium replicatum]
MDRIYSGLYSAFILRTSFIISSAFSLNCSSLFCPCYTLFAENGETSSLSLVILALVVLYLTSNGGGCWVCVAPCLP